MNARVEELLGPFDNWQVCPHAPADGCGCRKPRPGLVLAAAAALGVPAERCVVIGDIGADVGAARAAGARAVLVPTTATRPEEVAAAPAVAADLVAAVELALAGGGAVRRRAGGPAGQRGRRAARRPGGPRGRRAAPTGSCCSSARAAGRRPRCCPASTRSGLAGAVDRPRARPGGPGRRRGPRRAARAGFAEAVLLTSYHQSPLPLALLLRLAGVPRIARGQRRLPRARCWTSGTGWTATCRRRSVALSTAAAAGFALPPGDDGRLRVRGRCRTSAALDRPRPVRRAAPGRVGAGPGLVAATGARPRSRRLPPPATGWWSPAARPRRR